MKKRICQQKSEILPVCVFTPGGGATKNACRMLVPAGEKDSVFFFLFPLHYKTVAAGAVVQTALDTADGG